MSGNPNPPPPRNGGGGGPPDDGDCGRLRFDAQLASPVPIVVATLASGSVLQIELQEHSGVRVIAAVDVSGAVAGTIVDRISQLLRCLQLGYRYSATVINITGGAVTVDVAPTA